MNRGCKYSKFECCGGQIRLDHPLHSLELRSCCAGRAGQRGHNVSSRERAFSSAAVCLKWLYLFGVGSAGAESQAVCLVNEALPNPP